MSDRLRLVCADLTAASLPGVEGPFDLLVDYGTLDDLVPTDRRAMASAIIRLARPGSIFVLYAFYAAGTWGPDDAARIASPSHRDDSVTAV